jgi:hypothetical protein
MKLYIAIIFFSTAFLGCAEQPVRPEDDESFAYVEQPVPKELPPTDNEAMTPMELWGEMRAQPEITETSGIKKTSKFFDAAATAKIKKLPRAKKVKRIKGEKPEEKPENPDETNKIAKKSKDDKQEVKPDGVSKTTESKSKKQMP